MTTPARSRPRRARPAASVLVTWSLLAAALLLSTSNAQPEAAAVAVLPVARVVLFSTGVAYVEHAGSVAGDATVELWVAPEAMDDLLQSLVVADLGGGRVDGVRYGTRDPLGRILASYPIDLSRDPSLADVLAQARGERVRVTTDVVTEGVILGVERVPVPNEAPRAYLTVFDAGRLVRVDLAEVRDLAFESEALRAQLDAALGAIAAYRDATEVPVRIALRGDGEREVRVGYLREMPVWKTSYRLVLDVDATRADLQGWAIFDNPTSLDFEDVALTFVAGAPASFVSALFEPVYADRPRLEAAVTAGFVPPTDGGAMAVEAARSLMMTAPMAPSPAMMADAAVAEAAFGAGVEALAEGVATGATFSYAVREPVTVRRFESVLVPILRADVPAAQVSLFDARADARHPLRAVRVVNETGLHLAPGPVTVFDAGGFTGNALLPDLVPGDDRLVSYAVDLEVAVDVEARSEPERVVSVRFDGGVLVSEHRSRLVSTYRLAPRGDVTRFVVVEHPRRPGYEVVAPTPLPTVTADAHRFGVVLAAADAEPALDPSVAEHMRCDDGGTCVLEVVLERLEARRVAVTSVPLDRIEVYLQDLALDGTTRERLERVAEAQRELIALDRALSEERARREAIVADQGRIRQNMAALDRTSALYRRYVDELTEQEDTLAEIAARADALVAERAAAQAALDALVRSFGD